MRELLLSKLESGMRSRYTFLGLIITISVIIVYWTVSYYHRTQPAEEMRCSTFVRMDLSTDASHKVLIDAVINFQRTSSGAFLLIKGSASNEAGKTSLSRELVLIKKQQDKKNGFEYIIKRIDVGPVDDTPDNVFNDFLSEISADNRHFFLNDDIDRDDAILFGGPYSSIFMCVRY